MALPFTTATAAITRRTAETQRRATVLAATGVVVYPSQQGEIDIAPYGPSGAPAALNRQALYTLILPGEISYTPRIDDRVTVTGAGNQNGTYTIISEALEWQGLGLDSKQCIMVLNREA